MECSVCHKRLWPDATACDFCGGAPGPLSSWRTVPDVYDVPPPGAFSDLDRPARLLTWTLLGAVGFSVLAVWDSARRLDRLRDPDDLTLLELRSDALDGGHAQLGVVHVLVVCAVAAAYAGWVFRAYGNARRTGSALPWTETWAMAWPYVPVLGLWRPKQVMDQLWQTSDPALGPRDGDGWRSRRRSPLVLAWWLTCLAAAALGNASLVLSSEVGDLRRTSWLDIAAAAASGLAAVLLVVLVRRVHVRQAARLAAFRQPGPVL